MQKIQQGFFRRTVRRVMSRVRISLFVAERVWVKWVFKSSKEMSEQSLQALILAAIAIVLLLQTIVLAGRKPLRR
jgi:hypothetical protein